MSRFPCSGEINFKVADAKAAIEAVTAKYAPLDPEVDTTDGISADFGEWRLNLRSSNTEPLVRLNVESRGNPALVDEKVAEIREVMAQAG
jgi:phosphomannomutase/phosphoglucomutase